MRLLRYLENRTRGFGGSAEGAVGQVRGRMERFAAAFGLLGLDGRAAPRDVVEVLTRGPSLPLADALAFVDSFEVGDDGLVSIAEISSALSATVAEEASAAVRGRTTTLDTLPDLAALPFGGKTIVLGGDFK